MAGRDVARKGIHGGIRAFTCEDAEARVGRHMAGLAPMLGTGQALARALRAARKAALRGGMGYDPARHAALVRLARQNGLQASAGAGVAETCEARAPAVEGRGAMQLHRPSNSAVER